MSELQEVNVRTAEDIDGISRQLDKLAAFVILLNQAAFAFGEED